MSKDAGRDWRLYVDDMLYRIEKVQGYTRGMSQEAFVANELTFDASLRNLELIGEAASRIPNTVRTAWPAIPWRQIIATRNRLIHGYLGIDNDTIWSIIESDLPSLRTELNNMKNATDQT